jgi:hypothetical protein
METVCSSETLVTFYRTAVDRIKEDGTFSSVIFTAIAMRTSNFTHQNTMLIPGLGRISHFFHMTGFLKITSSITDFN